MEIPKTIMIDLRTLEELWTLAEELQVYVDELIDRQDKEPVRLSSIVDRFKDLFAANGDKCRGGCSHIQCD